MPRFSINLQIQKNFVTSPCNHATANVVSVMIHFQIIKKKLKLLPNLINKVVLVITITNRNNIVLFLFVTKLLKFCEKIDF